MSLNKQQEVEIIEALSRVFCIAEFLVDGYQFIAKTVVVDKRLVIGWYCKGSFRGEWLINDCEERRRFCPVKTKQLYSAKKKQSFVKIFGKKRAEALTDKTITHHGYLWTSAAAMLRHLKANNKSIDLVKLDNCFL